MSFSLRLTLLSLGRVLTRTTGVYYVSRIIYSYYQGRQGLKVEVLAHGRLDWDTPPLDIDLPFHAGLAMFLATCSMKHSSGSKYCNVMLLLA